MRSAIPTDHLRRDSITGRQARTGRYRNLPGESDLTRLLVEAMLQPKRGQVLRFGGPHCRLAFRCLIIMTNQVQATVNDVEQ